MSTIHSMLSRPLIGSIFLVAAAIAVAGCTNEPFEIQPCPAISISIDTVYQVKEELGFDKEHAGELPDGRYAGHPLAVPVAGGLTLTITTSLDAGGGLVPAVSLYGPRQADGVFGACAVLGAQIHGAVTSTLTYDVPEGEGGEYLVLVGGNPIALQSGGYTVEVECESEDGECKGETCPVLLGACTHEICPGGFLLSDAGNGGSSTSRDDNGVLVCPVCACATRSCSGFEDLVIDKCVCGCTLPEEPQAVCGADGKTYKSECFAGCAGVAVAKETACKDSCPSVAGCALECEFGLTVVAGCKQCECASACDKKSALYEPVCGTDGLTYTNLDRLRCAAQVDGTGVEVAYLGVCLPYCELPCSLSCKVGLLPTPGVGKACFECKCADAMSVRGCKPDGDQWCALKPVPGTPPPPEGGHQKPQAVTAENLARHRTFPDNCTPPATGWKPVIGAACPSGVCAKRGECLVGLPILNENFNGQTDAFRRSPDGLTTNPFGTERPPFQCIVPEEGSVGGCIAGQGKNQLPCDPKSKELGNCPPGSTCVVNPKLPVGGSCLFDCDCLNKIGGRSYQPVCATGKDGQKSYLNSCVALCQKAWPIDYPGTCCETRMTQDELRKHIEAVDAVCKEHKDSLQARIRLDTACPPTVEECEKEENKKLCCTEPEPGRGGPKPPGS